MKKRLSGALLFAAAFQMMVGLAEAASCGNTGEGFEAWKSTFADEAQTNGTSQKAISALMGTSYSSGTIAADRSQKSFTLSLDAFMAKRGAAAIAAKGKSLKATNAALFASIENAFGVPAGPLIAIWGMETGFGAFMGNQNTLSAITTLAYDCRRSEYFTDAALRNAEAPRSWPSRRLHPWRYARRGRSNSVSTQEHPALWR